MNDKEKEILDRLLENVKNKLNEDVSKNIKSDGLDGIRESQSVRIGDVQNALEKGIIEWFESNYGTDFDKEYYRVNTSPNNAVAHITINWLCEDVMQSYWNKDGTELYVTRLEKSELETKTEELK